eukprot:TRINITY_DN64786_c0_g1_i1.p1 TRINITY_DN64786_c0_g1~~TRINITY_DN64786_c0_g1_i1.p1  ORF type:complete len:151 (-),score=23.54 TRINITY_DN64786_c0_g1_i1:109-561(-)
MIFTLFATIDSVSLFVAMTGCVAVSCFLLKQIADLEHDLANPTDFVRNMYMGGRLEHFCLFLNFVALLPFFGTWWMVPPQLFWIVIKAVRFFTGGTKLDEREIFKRSVYLQHRRWHMSGLFLYLVTWFLYFARLVTAIMDIHIHGVSPYD